MKTLQKENYLFLLAVLFSLSFFKLNGYLAAILFLCIAGVLWLISKQAHELVPPIGFVAVAYLFGYAMPFLLPSFYQDLWNEVPSQALEYGMLWATRGFGAFVLGYALVDYHGKRANKQTSQKEILIRKGDRYTFYLIYSIGWLSLLSWFLSTGLYGISLTFIEKGVVTVVTSSGTLKQIFVLLINLRYPFFVAFFILHNKKQTSRQLILLFILLLSVSIIEIISIGSKGSIIRLLMTVLLAQSFLRTHLNFKQIIRIFSALIIVYGSFAIISEYRSIMRSENRAGRDVLAFSVQAESFKSAFLSSIPFSENSRKRNVMANSETVLHRFGSGIFSLANLMRHTRQQPPYHHALESFLAPIYSFMPRDWVPGKPKFFDSGSNAKRYYGWSYGGISVSLLGSFYYAWGYMGIIFGMFFIGVFVAYIIQKVYISNKYAIHYLIIFVMLVLFILEVGEIFQVYIINVVRTGFVLWLLHILYPLFSSAKSRYRIRRPIPQVYRDH